MVDQVNNKLQRAVAYEGNRVRLFTVIVDPERPSNKLFKQVDLVDRATAHKWFHGQESRDEVPATDPTVDEMIEVITERLKADIQPVIDHALATEDNLMHLYECAKRGRLVRPYW